MSFLIDLVLLAIIAYYAWRGWKSGLIVSAFSVVTIIICVVIGNILASTFSSDFTSVMEPFATGLIDGQIAEVTESNPSGEKGISIAEVMNVLKNNTEKNDDGEKDAKVEEALGNEENQSAFANLTDKEKRDVYHVSYAVICELGVADGAAEKIAKEAAEDTDEVGQPLAGILSEKLCAKFSYVVVFAVTFILSLILFAFLGNILDIRLELPGLEKANNISGAVLGGIKGIILVLFICCVCRYLGIIIGETRIHKTVILEWLMNKNIIANILGI